MLTLERGLAEHLIGNDQVANNFFFVLWQTQAEPSDSLFSKKQSITPITLALNDDRLLEKTHFTSTTPSMSSLTINPKTNLNFLLYTNPSCSPFHFQSKMVLLHTVSPKLKSLL
jgi:hypothetical protein